MYNKLSQINKRFVKQSIILLIFVIVISSAGVFITGSSSIRSTNKWGTKTAESLILKQKLFLTNFLSPQIFTLSVSKEALKNLKELYTKRK